ncbi:hypothetical protein N7495_004596 [Penicillium taxi]|uniref:uncharacterized protein n=1 Tax=Penicillium taxi TaxID=168475 RepID=UPI00254526AB|nr:uncharacterized protein N7495_004596 [Penicillium taxi]KAJ5899852.1 hypothetical protein N7495_004596 [Penicillium taxi]
MSPDFSSIVRSHSFTFLVGPEHTKLSIQSALAQHVSKPLHNLMNNGHTRESKHRIAVLEDEDVETFVAFCEYAYTGDYKVPREERIITGVIESAGSVSSWKNTCRSDSVSSAVPPPAPTPPVGTVVEPVNHAPEPAPVAEEAEDEDEKEVKNTPQSEHGDGEIEEFHPVENLQEDEPCQSSIWDWTTPTSRKEKKWKKDRRAPQLEPMEESVPTEEPANLTPPSTPPPEAHPEETVEVNTFALEEHAETEQGTEKEVQAEDEPVAEGQEEAEDEPVAEGQEEAEDEPVAEGQEEAEDEPVAEGQEEAEAGAESQDEEQKELPKPTIDMSFAKQSDSSPRTPGLSLWDEFISLQYNDENTQTPFDTAADDYPYLTFHAKLYVFATRYLIPALAQLCLRKLHHDLQHISFEGADEETEEAELVESRPDLHSDLASRHASMVLELLRYTYNKTTRLEPISPTSATQLRENELRRLVTHYAACKVKDLAGHQDSGDATPFNRDLKRADAGPKSLRELLDQIPELASDLVYRMM